MRRFLGLLAVAALAVSPLFALDEDQGSEGGGDIVHFASNVYVPAGQDARDVVCFLCSVEVEGTVHRDIVVFLGSVRIHGKAEHDVVVFAGSVSVHDNSSIGHDLVIMGGQRHLDSTAVIGHDSVIFPPVLIAVPLLIAAGIILLLVRFVRWLSYRNRPMYRQPYP